MYRINLYPEFAEKRESARQAVVHRVALIALICLQSLVIALLAVSGILLSERASGLRLGLTPLQQRVAEASQPQPERQVAQALIDMRLNRVDWAPKLAAVGERLDDTLQLTRLSGKMAERRTPAKFEVGGKVRNGRDELEKVTRYIDALKGDPRVTANFPDIRLDSVKGDGSGKFNVYCASEGGDR